METLRGLFFYWKYDTITKDDPQIRDLDRVIVKEEMINNGLGSSTRTITGYYSNKHRKQG